MVTGPVIGMGPTHCCMQVTPHRIPHCPYQVQLYARTGTSLMTRHTIGYLAVHCVMRADRFLHALAFDTCTVSTWALLMARHDRERGAKALALDSYVCM